jgi:hypothetical protein
MAGSPDTDVHVKPTQYGLDLGLDLPSADPTAALVEIERRRGVAGLDPVKFDEKTGVLQRSKTARNPGPDTRLPPEIAMSKRVQFEHDHAGFFIINAANEQFSTRCIKPNIRVLSFHKTKEQADRRALKLMEDPRVTSVPIIVPANYPFMIPFSEKAALDERRTRAKLERNFVKYNEYIRLRNEEFARRVGDGDKKEGVMEASTYHRRKIYLARQKEREQRRKEDGSALLASMAGLGSDDDAGAGVAAGLGLGYGHGLGTGVGAGAGAGARTGTGEGGGALSGTVLPEFGDGSFLGGGGGGGGAAAAPDAVLRARAREAATDMQLASKGFNDAMKRVRAAEAEAAAEAAGLAAEAAAAAAAAGNSPEDKEAALEALPVLGGVYDGKPRPHQVQKLTTAKRQAKQQAKAKKLDDKARRERLHPKSVSGVSASLVPGAKAFQSADGVRPLLRGDLPAHWRPTLAGGRRGQTADEWPRDLESRHGKFVIISYVDDIDTPDEDPAYPDAASMEPIVVLFAGEFENEAKAREFLIKEISSWCTDLDLDVVDMYEWLWPTEVDPDSLTEEHRTSNAGFTQELNTVMKQRKRTLETTAEARAQSALLGVPLHETNVNDIELPDASEVIKATRPGMWIHGDVIQYDAEGKPIEGFEAAVPETGAGFRVDDGSKEFSKLYVTKLMAEEEAAEEAVARGEVVAVVAPEPEPEPEPEPVVPRAQARRKISRATEVEAEPAAPKPKAPPQVRPKTYDDLPDLSSL